MGTAVSSTCTRTAALDRACEVSRRALVVTACCPVEDRGAHDHWYHGGCCRRTVFISSLSPKTIGHGARCCERSSMIFRDERRRWRGVVMTPSRLQAPVSGDS
jgi:hypothetical protein